MNQTEMMLAAARILGTLGLMTAALFVLLRLFKRGWGMKIAKERRMRIVETHYIGFKNMVCLLEITGEATLVLAVTRDRIRLLHKMEPGRKIFPEDDKKGEPLAGIEGE